jgi:hypothetical protein
MWISRKKFKELETKLNERLEVVTCAVCGCLVNKWWATRGKGVIGERIKHRRYPYTGYDIEEYVYHPYYCKVHAPKEDEEEMK